MKDEPGSDAGSFRRVPSVELVVRVDDGSFESTLRVPVDAPPASRLELVAEWLRMMDRALAVARARRDEGP